MPFRFRPHTLVKYYRRLESNNLEFNEKGSKKSKVIYLVS